MKKDIELTMDDIKSIAITNLDSLISSINSEKNDSITLQGLIKNDALEVQNYYMWEMLNPPPYAVSYFQDLINEVPAVDAIQGEEALTYFIRLAVLLRTDGTSFIPKEKIRYYRVLKSLVHKYICPKYTNVVIQKAGCEMVKQGGHTEYFQIPYVVFSISIIE